MKAKQSISKFYFSKTDAKLFFLKPSVTSRTAFYNY